MILDLQEHILKRLPRNARAGTARLLSRYYAALFADEVTIYARDADLPDEVLQRWYVTLTNSERYTVMNVRAGEGDLRHVQWLRERPRGLPGRLLGDCQETSRRFLVLQNVKWSRQHVLQRL